jgi:hypothetical protein
MRRITVTFRQMIEDSVAVMTRPSIEAFNRYGRRGDAVDAAKYVGAAALVGALIGLLALIGVVGNVGVVLQFLVGTIGSVLQTLLRFFFFVFLIQIIGQQQGGMGEFDNIAYAFALFVAPIAMLETLLVLLLPALGLGGAVTLVPLIALAAQAFYAYLATQATLRLRRPRQVAITLGGAVAAMLVINLLFRGTAGLL